MNPIKRDVHKNSARWAGDVLQFLSSYILVIGECGFLIPDHLGFATGHKTFGNVCLSFLIWGLVIYYSLYMVSIPYGCLNL